MLHGMPPRLMLNGMAPSLMLHTSILSDGTTCLSLSKVSDVCLL
jgi:hypothetical protein